MATDAPDNNQSEACWAPGVIPLTNIIADLINNTFTIIQTIASISSARWSLGLSNRCLNWLIKIKSNAFLLKRNPFHWPKQSHLHSYSNNHFHPQGWIVNQVFKLRWLINFKAIHFICGAFLIDSKALTLGDGDIRTGGWTLNSCGSLR